MLIKYKLPEKFRSKIENYKLIAQIGEKLMSTRKGSIRINFIENRWFDLNLTSILEMLLLIAKQNENNFRLVNIRHALKKQFYLNNFFSKISDPIYTDTVSSSSVSFKIFHKTNEKEFAEYINSELFSKFITVNIDNKDRNDILRSMCELFSNSVIHSGSEYIACCGQYYKRFKYLDFTIVDIGKTIQSNVSEYLKKEISGLDALIWALEKGNTTRRGDIPGGLGFYVVRNHLQSNSGRLQILSASGFYQQTAKRKKFENFLYSFPGVIITLRFNLNERVHSISNKVV